MIDGNLFMLVNIEEWLFERWLSEVLLDELTGQVEGIGCYCDKEAVEDYVDDSAHFLSEVQPGLEVYSDRHSKQPPETYFDVAVEGSLTLLSILALNGHRQGQQQADHQTPHKIYSLQ